MSCSLKAIAGVFSKANEIRGFFVAIRQTEYSLFTADITYSEHSLSLHENLALTNFDLHQKYIKVG